MNFKFSSDHEAVRDTFKKLCREELAPLLDPAEEPEQFAQRVFRRWGGLGLIGVHLPEGADGSGLDSISDCIVREELSHFSKALASSWFARTHLDIWSTEHRADQESRSRLPERSVSEIGDAWRENLGVCFE
jgi:butyryl-CoA dehydrogenase